VLRLNESPYIVLSLVTLAGAVGSGCNVRVRSQERTPTLTALRVTCEPDSEVLRCRATGERSTGDTDLDGDLTDTVRWTSSNVNAATIVRGRVFANGPGIASIIASLGSGADTLSSALSVVVDRAGRCPEVGYDVAGVARDFSNSALAHVELSLVDGQGRSMVTRTDESRSDGAFTFAPVVRGTYQLRASKAGYRPFERIVIVPDPTPLTVVLMLEPR